MTAIQLKQEIKMRISPSNKENVEEQQPKKRKVKDLSPEKKKEFLQRVYQQSRKDNPDFYAMLDRMKFTEEDINDPDERVQYILSK